MSSIERPESLLEQLLVVRQRQAELRAYARPRKMPSELRVGRHRVVGPHFHIGSLVVAIGRTLYDEEGRRPNPARS